MTNGVSQVANTVADSLRSQPALLSIITLNVLLLGAGVWVLMRIADNSAKDKQHMYEVFDRCIPGREKS